MVAIEWRRGRSEKVSAELADVQDAGCAGTMAVFPESRSGEFACEAESARISEGVAKTGKESCSMEQGKWRVCSQREILLGMTDIVGEWI